MKPSLVSYTRTFNLGNYNSEKIGVEIEIDTGESPSEALSKAKEIVDKFHEDNKPQQEPTDEYRGTTERTLEPAPVLNRIQQMAKDIGTSKDLTTLKTYEFLISRHKNEDEKKILQSAYDERLKQLNQ
jgi:hypothetical protein